MAKRATRAATIQNRRLIEIATAGACVGFATIAIGAVVLDRKVAPSEIPTAMPLPPVQATDGAAGGEAFVPIPALIARGLASSYKLQPKTPPPEQGESGQADPEAPPPQQVALVATIGQPGSMVAIIREGAAQSVIGPGQRAGSVEVIEVSSGSARIRHLGQVKELSVGQPMLLVSDMGGGGGGFSDSQAILRSESEGVTRTNPDGTTTTIAQPPSRLQRAQPGGVRSGSQGGGPAGGGSGNSGNSPNPSGGNNNNGNQQPASGGRPTQGQSGQSQQQGAEDRR